MRAVGKPAPAWTLVPSVRRWLSPADEPRSADLIFVLAGRMYRKDYALELFRQQIAPGILFSVGRFEIRRFSQMPLPVPLDLLKIAQDVPPPQRHYFVFFKGQHVEVQHIFPGRFGTLTEITVLAHWLEEHPAVRSVLILSDASHLRRIRLCCRSLLNPGIECAYIATPDSGSPDTRGQERGSHSSVDELVEFLKVLLYWSLLRLRWASRPRGGS